MAMSDDFIEKRCAVTGIGQSEIGRRLYRDPLELTLDACLAAVDDAGLTLDDIDGLSTYPGAMGGPQGFSGAGAYDVIDALRLKVGWYDSGVETSGQLGSVMKAVLAVGAGLANHVICFRSVWEHNSGPCPSMLRQRRVGLRSMRKHTCIAMGPPLNNSLKLRSMRERTQHSTPTPSIETP